jgi:arylsulfatase A-like enzyme
MMGRSLWPIATGTTDVDHHRDDVYCESYNACHGHNGASEQPAWATMVRTDSYKLVVAHGHRTGELYNVADDPNETHNLWNDKQYAEIRLDMMNRLVDRMAMTVDPLPERHAPW